MKLKSGFVLCRVGDDNIVVPVGEQTDVFNGIFAFNETGVFLWDQLQEEKDEEELVNALLGEYEVTREVALADVKKFLEKLRTAGLLMQ